VSERRRPRLASRPPPPQAFARGATPRPEARTEPPRLVRELGASMIGRVLILDEDSAAASAAADALAADGHGIELHPRIEDGLRSVGRLAPDVVVIDPWSGDAPGEDVIDQLRRVRDPLGAAPEVIVVTSLHDVDAAVECLHRGAADYIVKPVAAGRLRLAIARALERLRLLNENVRLRQDLALYAAAQRMLETLDAQTLSAFGLDALCSFTRADAGVLFHGDACVAERGVSEAERHALARLPRPVNFTDRIALPKDDPILHRFQEAMLLDLDDARAAVLLSSQAFDAAREEHALFLARQLQTAFRNGLRFADAEREARRDSLTGLWNARAFQESVHGLVAQATEAKASFSVLFLDVDHFKSVNDRFGHTTGSRLLVELADVLSGCLREGDVVARYGGDEFTVLLPEVDIDAALRVAERIRATIAAHPFSAARGVTLPVTVCVGVASFPRHAQDAQAILDMADRAMYVGKGSIRNSVHVAGAGP
jgi:two-component system cell cycle response regulator